MTAELRNLSTTVSANVSRLYEIPIHVKVQGLAVYTYPMQGLDVKAVAGTLWWDGFETVAWPGAVLEFKNELTKSIGMNGFLSYKVVFATASSSILYGGNSSVSFSIDYETGTLIASVPCDAVVVVESKSVQYNRWTYTPPIFSTNISPSAGKAIGNQLDGPVPELFSDIIYAIHKPAGWPKNKAQVVTEKIQMPQTTIREAFSLNQATIVTPEGEFFKPKDWDKDTYDKDKAFKLKDGTYGVGPDKTGSWLENTHTFQSWNISADGTITDTHIPLNGKMKYASTIDPSALSITIAKSKDLEDTTLYKETVIKKASKQIEAAATKYGATTAPANIPMSNLISEKKS